MLRPGAAGTYGGEHIHGKAGVAEGSRLPPSGIGDVSREVGGREGLEGSETDGVGFLRKSVSTFCVGPEGGTGPTVGVSCKDLGFI